MESYKIGLFGSMIFLGWSICSLGQRIGDIYGIKWPIFISLLMSIAAYIGMLTTKSLAIMSGLLFVIGLTVAKLMVGYVFIQDITPARYHTFVGTGILVIDSATRTQ